MAEVLSLVRFLHALFLEMLVPPPSFSFCSNELSSCYTSTLQLDPIYPELKTGIKNYMDVHNSKISVIAQIRNNVLSVSGITRPL